LARKANRYIDDIDVRLRNLYNAADMDASRKDTVLSLVRHSAKPFLGLINEASEELRSARYSPRCVRECTNAERTIVQKWLKERDVMSMKESCEFAAKPSHWKVFLLRACSVLFVCCTLYWPAGMTVTFEHATCQLACIAYTALKALVQSTHGSSRCAAWPAMSVVAYETAVVILMKLHVMRVTSLHRCITYAYVGGHLLGPRRQAAKMSLSAPDKRIQSHPQPYQGSRQLPHTVTSEVHEYLVLTARVYAALGCRPV
jgi:hypothetical protein